MMTTAFGAVVRRLQQVPHDSWKVSVRPMNGAAALEPAGHLIFLDHATDHWEATISMLREYDADMVYSWRAWQDSVRYSPRRLGKAFLDRRFGRRSNKHTWWRIAVYLKANDTKSLEFLRSVREGSREFDVVTRFVGSIAQGALQLVLSEEGAWLCEASSQKLAQLNEAAATNARRDEAGRLFWES